MSIDLKFLIKSTSSSNTEQIAETIGHNLKGGEVLVLNSDLGGGKTTFTRGLLRGLGSQDTVSSPTFTISKIYSAKGLKVHHFDFYRLSEPGLIANELSEVMYDKNNIVVIEWADIVKSILPQKSVFIDIEYNSETGRLLTINYSKELSYIIEGLK